jgi:hypothetical protein
MHAVPEPVAPPAFHAVDELPGRDARAKRPPLLSFLLRWSTLRRVTRVFSLLALDLAGVFLAIFTALLLKNLLHGKGTTAIAFAQTRGYAPFACLVTVCSSRDRTCTPTAASAPGLRASSRRSSR